MSSPSSWLRPPSGLLRRIRWLFLLCSVLNVVAVLPMLVWKSDAAPVLRIAGFAGAAVLCIYWIRSYARSRFWSAGELIELAALGALCLSLRQTDTALGVIYCGLYFRALYGSWRRVILIALVFGVCYLGPGLLDPLVRIPMSETAQQVMGFAISSSVMALVASFGSSHERAALRERALSQAGAALVAATGPADIYAATLTGVRALLPAIDLTRVSLSVAIPDTSELTVVSSEGSEAEHAFGRSIDLRRVPPPFQLSRTTRQIVVDVEGAAHLGKALGFRTHPGIVVATPLRSREQLLGVLVIETPKKLPEEFADAINTLAAESGLALETMRLTEHLRHDIAKREALEGELAHRAYHDTLTELPNRALLVERLQHALARGARVSTRPVLVFIDLDDFKLVNDSLGHTLGDELLVSVSQRLRAAIRAGDTAARLGGDEFVLLLEDIGDPTVATGVVERFLSRLQEPFILDGHEVFVGASVGIAFSRGEGTLPDDLLREADVAMYLAKTAGKRRYVVYEPSLEAQPLERLELESDLRRALERGELRLHYQPIVDLEQDRLCGVEALLRWQHPSRGLVPPAEFIPVAERNGLIVPVGRWALRQACVDTKAWQDEHPDAEPLVVSVNLSARQFLDPALVADVDRALADAGLDAACLKLEITESTAMEAGIGTIETFQALKGLGVQLAIDDFGTGYSSLSYLKRFPVDTLKIDRSFVDGLGRDVQDTAIVRSVIALARSLNLNVTAEGIETPEQWQELRDLACDQGQGYYFARPQPSVDAALFRASKSERSEPNSAAA